jgi:hypothetical protein
MLSDDQDRLLTRLRWTAFALLACAYVLVFFHRTAPAAIAGELTRDFAVGPRRSASWRPATSGSTR